MRNIRFQVPPAQVICNDVGLAGDMANIKFNASLAGKFRQDFNKKAQRFGSCEAFIANSFRASIVTQGFQTDQDEKLPLKSPNQSAPRFQKTLCSCISASN